MADGLFLIDTSIWIWALRPSGVAAIRHRLDEVLAKGKGATTPLILLELLSGAREEKDYTELSEDLSALHQFPISGSVWKEAIGLASISGDRE
jgi:predicted nucleic acid-binding protein